jgi:hypothetical protein
VSILTTTTEGRLLRLAQQKWHSDALRVLTRTSKTFLTRALLAVSSLSAVMAAILFYGGSVSRDTEHPPSIATPSPPALISQEDPAPPTEPSLGEATHGLAGAERSKNPITPSATKQPEPTASALALEVRAAQSTASRIELIEQLAGLNTPEAVQWLRTLYPEQRLPQIKASLVSVLADIDESHAPEARLNLLAQALRGEPRNVRSAAVEVLGQSETPAATKLLREVKSSDPDYELREVAAEFLKDREDGTDVSGKRN